jgi:asparagine synthase (glutamine-hydrolysing)
MCGIFALLLSHPLDPTDVECGRRGRDMLVHRGPDGAGEFIDRGRGVYIGHRRLKIIDLTERAAQPMQAGGLVLAYNGEIYNYGELRQELGAGGCSFRSESDTEVLLALWQKHGSAALDKIEGMFALILWDGRGARLAVDRFGEKSLFVAETADGVIVSSELRPILSVVRPAVDLDDDLVAEYMSLGYVSLPRTFYRGVRRLEPGTMISVSNGRIGATERYWQPPTLQRGRGPAQPLSERELDRLQALIVDSLRLRLVADVPLCLFLSNGIDSSLVAAICAQDLKRPVETLTVTFPGGDAPDESEAAAAFARRVGIAHRSIAVRDHVGSLTPQSLLDVFGQPNDNTGVVAVQGLAAAARSGGYTVGLTGNGGDEAFFGYQKQAFAWRYRRVYALPEALRGLFGELTTLAVPFSKRAAIFRDVFAVGDHERYAALKNRWALPLLRNFRGFGRWSQRRFGGETDFSMQVPEFERRDVLPGSQLLAVDHGSMKASVELRTPFLDRRLVEALAEFDARSFLAFGRKSVLRRLLARYVPLESVERGKKGLVFPAAPFVEHLQRDAPDGVRVSDSVVATIWERRYEPHWQRLAVRLSLLQALPRWLRRNLSAPTAGPDRVATATI